MDHTDSSLVGEENSPTSSSSLQADKADTLSIIENTTPASTSKPKKTRALVYQFFEWIADISQYECKLCKYGYNHLLISIHNTTSIVEKNMRCQNQAELVR